MLLRNKIWNLPWTCCWLTFYIVTPGPAVWLELFASTVCRFLSKISYLLLYAFLQRCCSFTLRKLYLRLNTFLHVCFLHISDQAYVTQARCIGLFFLLFILAPLRTWLRFATRMPVKDLTAVWHWTKKKMKPEFQLRRCPWKARVINSGSITRLLATPTRNPTALISFKPTRNLYLPCTNGKPIRNYFRYQTCCRTEL